MSPHILSDDGVEMLLVPEGQFETGISDSDLKELAGDADRAARFRIGYNEAVPGFLSLPSFYIDKFPVTNRQFRLFLEKTSYRKIPNKLDSKIWGGDKQPVIAVDWSDAKAYAQWCGKRLPSELEWERAARGERGNLFPWGNRISPQNCNCFESGLECTTDVDSYPQGISPYGAYDMAGNVWEMTATEWEWEAPVMKGGCFLTYVRFCRSSARWAPSTEELENGAKWLGFRCVKDA